MKNLFGGMYVPFLRLLAAGSGGRLRLLLLIITLLWNATDVSGQGIVLSPLPEIAGGALSTADFDGDGDLDIYLTGVDSAGVLQGGLYERSGTSFSLLASSLPVVSNGQAVWADIDADGDLDLALCGQSSSGNFATIWRNTGSGFSAVSAGNAVLQSGTLAWADMDGDGDADLVGAGIRPGSMKAGFIWRNDGVSGFSVVSAPWGGPSASVLAHDFDGDGKVDIAVLARAPFTPDGHRLEIWRNLGNLQFVRVSLPPAPPKLDEGEPALLDFDGDGRLDIVLPSANSGGVAIARNLSSGWVWGVAGAASVSHAVTTSADFDNDGRTDLVVLGTTPTIQAWLNTVGGFVSTGSSLPQWQAVKAVMGDIDGDGDPDLILSGFSLAGSPLSTILYYSSGTFQP